MYIFTYINILVKSNPPIPIFSFEQEYAKYQPGILVFFCRRYLAILINCHFMLVASSPSTLQDGG